MICPPFLRKTEQAADIFLGRCPTVFLYRQWSTAIAYGSFELPCSRTHSSNWPISEIHSFWYTSVAWDTALYFQRIHQSRLHVREGANLPNLHRARAHTCDNWPRLTRIDQLFRQNKFRHNKNCPHLALNRQIFPPSKFHGLRYCPSRSTGQLFNWVITYHGTAAPNESQTTVFKRLVSLSNFSLAPATAKTGLWTFTCPPKMAWSLYTCIEILCVLTRQLEN